MVAGRLVIQSYNMMTWQRAFMSSCHHTITSVHAVHACYDSMIACRQARQGGMVVWYECMTDLPVFTCFPDWHDSPVSRLSCLDCPRLNDSMLPCVNYHHTYILCRKGRSRAANGLVWLLDSMLSCVVCGHVMSSYRQQKDGPFQTRLIVILLDLIDCIF